MKIVPIIKDFNNKQNPKVNRTNFNGTFINNSEAIADSKCIGVINLVKNFVENFTTDSLNVALKLHAKNNNKEGINQLIFSNNSGETGWNIISLDIKDTSKNNKINLVAYLPPKFNINEQANNIIDMLSKNFPEHIKK